MKIVCPTCNQEREGWPDSWRNRPPLHNPRGLRYVCAACTQTTPLICCGHTAVEHGNGKYENKCSCMSCAIVQHVHGQNRPIPAA